MKLLFDQNLSHHLPRLLAVEYPCSAHVRDFGLSKAADPIVWNYAANAGFVIVSKDVDFQQRATLYGSPPKVIWVRLGNCTTAAVELLLRSRQLEIREFEADPAASFLVIS